MSNKTIIKKSSEIEEFSESKLKKSIINAFKAVSMGYSKKLIDNIVSQLVIEDKTTSNDIRNQLEVILMNSGYYNVAKAFIAYEQKKLVQNRDVADRIDFIKKYCESINSASGSQFDANANVDNKNIATLIGEIPKGIFIKINRKLLYDKIKKLYGKKTADKYIKLLKNHHLYKNDETSINSYTYSGENKFYIYHKEEKNYTEVRFDEFYNNLAVDEYFVDRENAVYQKFPNKLYIKDKNGYTKVLALTKKKRHRDMYKVTLFDGKSIIVTDNHPLIVKDNKNDTVDADKINNSYAQYVISEGKWVEIKESVKINSNEEWIYDVTTESETLVVNDIWCHNCASITMYPWLLNGTRDIGGNSVAPSNLKAFCGGLINMVFIVSSMLAGAVSTPELFLYMNYFIEKEYGEDYYKDPNKIVDLSKKQRTLDKVITDCFEQIVYSINQPTGARGFQAVFYNCAYYDKYYFNSLFEDFVFPDGTKPHWEGVSWLQKRFMKWFNRERKKTVLTFPVETMAMLYETDEQGNVHFKDKEYENFTSEMYAEGHSFFTYLSDRADSLSSCCFSGKQEVMFMNDKSGIEIRPFEKVYDRWNDKYLVYHNGKWKNAKAIRLPSRKMYKILTDFGQTIEVSDNHLNPTNRGDIRTDKLTTDDYLRVEDDLSFINNREFSSEEEVDKIQVLKEYKFFQEGKLRYVKIKSIEQIEYNDDYIYCFEMKDQNEPYFTLPNGIITHNCRLRNELTDNTFSYTLGAGGVSSGSKSVLTINLNRVIQYAIQNNIDYKEYLTEVVELCHKVQTAYNENLKDLQNAGMLPLYDAGYIAINRQYLTIGINGMVEAAEFMGIEITDNPKYADFVEGILSIIENCNKKYRTKELMFNCEMIPAENVGVKHAKWDKEDGYVVPRDCYNSYFYKVEDKSLTIIDKIKLHGKKYIQHLTGGSALHLNLEEHLSKDQYKKILEIAAKEGCNYLTFNIPNTYCNDCGNIDKRYLKECPKCHSKNIDYLTRIIGYLKRISNFSEGRQIEAAKRVYHNANKENTEISK